jgi:MSHA biogenesis protein MshQ
MRSSVPSFLFFAGLAHGQVLLLQENFTGESVDNWTFVTGQGSGPSLTAAPGGPDTAGNGWLRLTEDQASQSSFVYNQTPISTENGLHIDFDFVIWSTTADVADGFTLALFDASVTPEAGAYGGSLGYAQRDGQDGLAGAVVGVGFDAFGNFALASEGRVGGPGKTPNAITLRGSVGNDRSEGYEYITTTGTLNQFSTAQAASRSDATIHSVRVTFLPTKQISVTIDDETRIDNFQCTLNCPIDIRVGFTAGTGSVTANQEIRNFSVFSAIPEPSSCTLLAAILGLGCCMRRREAVSAMFSN